ncbi:hypothetical protein [Polluticoccus soli]|uniref:hypothetical protein n=1 Tax=Polluticoccus soli TaxID=3034150 RepID=UPI0023E0A819|nr:hypothetical protein [Flavipsychrobacter sp. JY13-12]
MIKLRVFRAVDDLESCQKFVEGHMKILKNFGITMITSANIEWFQDPHTYVIVAEDTETLKVLGGARVQIAGGKYPLPIEKAVTELDESVHDIVKDYAKEGTAELCGLWNSREVAGMGIGSVFLTRTAVSIAPQIGIKSMFALCAAYTIQMAQKAGFQIATFMGNNGTFYYPKDDLVATAMVLPDVNLLETAHADEKAEILSLRDNPNQIKTEEGRRGPFDILYELAIPTGHEV